MTDAFSSRTEFLLQFDGVARMQAAHILVVGLGGVGGYDASFRLPHCCRSNQYYP